MTLFVDDPDFRLYVGDVREQLALLPDASVDCVVTSPPYFGLRDYGSEGQIGLEATPQEYVQTMVDVFREIHRVLAPHGTAWLNLGDSYAANRSYQVRDNKHTDVGNTMAASVPDGLKSKDLMGIPWRVAFALQQPYYTGRIKDARDRIWLAALVEAEGCMFIHKRKAGTDSGAKFTKKDGTAVSYARTQDTYGSGLEVSSTDRVIVERCMAIAGIGSICEQSPEQNGRRKQTIYRWNVRSNECRWIVEELYPYFYAKQHEARLLIGCPSSGPDAEKAHSSLKAIHNGQTPDIDFAPPKSMWEPGWFLRSDVIWAKPQPDAGVGRRPADEEPRVRVPAHEGAELLLRPGGGAGAVHDDARAGQRDPADGALWRRERRQRRPDGAPGGREGAVAGRVPAAGGDAGWERGRGAPWPRRAPPDGGPGARGVGAAPRWGALAERGTEHPQRLDDHDAAVQRCAARWW